MSDNDNLLIKRKIFTNVYEKFNVTHYCTFRQY